MIMREIKFRGLAIDGSGFVKGNYMHTVYKKADDKFQIYPPLYNVPPVDINPDTVGQFIGITDSMDKEIFTGDIVIDLKSRKYTVEFNDEFCAFFLYPIYDRESFMGIYPDIVLSIFGNVFENPELLN